MLTSKLFALDKIKNVSYSERNQANPLRWSVFYLDKENKYIRQTNPMMCKDFFNDMVAKYQGICLNIYGLDCEKINLNEYGVWLLLSNTTDQFIGNVERVLNPKLGHETGQILNPAKVEDLNGEVLVLIPRSLFNSTYTISYLTLVIRACNAAKDFSSWENLMTNSKETLIQSAPWLKDKNFLPPDHLKEYWWWQGEAYNSKKIAETTYGLRNFVHNNGVFAWVNIHGFTQEYPVLSATPVSSPVFA